MVLTLLNSIYIGSGIEVISSPDLPRPSVKQSESWVRAKDWGLREWFACGDIDKGTWLIIFSFFFYFFPFLIVTGLSGTLPGYLRRRNRLGINNDVIHGVYWGLGTIRWEPTYCLWYWYLRRATAVQIRHVEVSGKKNKFGKKLSFRLHQLEVFDNNLLLKFIINTLTLLASLFSLCRHLAIQNKPAKKIRLLDKTQGVFQLTKPFRISWRWSPMR